MAAEWMQGALDYLKVELDLHIKYEGLSTHLICWIWPTGPVGRVLHLAWKNFIIRDFAFHLKNGFMYASHAGTHSTATCHFPSYFSNFKHPRRQTRTDAVDTRTTTHFYPRHLRCAATSAPCEALYYQIIPRSSIMLLLLRFIRGHFSQCRQILWNKSTKAFMPASPESWEFGWMWFDRQNLTKRISFSCTCAPVSGVETLPVEADTRMCNAISFLLASICTYNEFLICSASTSLID